MGWTYEAHTMTRVMRSEIERVGSASTTLAARLQDVAAAMVDGNTVAGDEPRSDLDATSELPALLDAIVRDAIDKAGGSQQTVDMRVTSLPKGLIWIALEGTGADTWKGSTSGTSSTR